MNMWMMRKNSIEDHYVKKKTLYSHLKMEDITNADSTHEKRICKDFEMKHLGEYHDLYVQSNTLLLADIFGNFQNMCVETYELHPVRFPTAPELAWQAAFKITKAKLDLLTDIYKLLMVEKVSEEEYVTLLINMQKLITNT